MAVNLKAWTISQVGRNAQHAAVPTAAAAALRRAGALVGIYMMECVKARAAARLCEHLSHRSDAELARFGISRAEIPQYINQQFYG